jgi:hypothetical protein
MMEPFFLTLNAPKQILRASVANIKCHIYIYMYMYIHIHIYIYPNLQFFQLFISIDFNPLNCVKGKSERENCGSKLNKESTILSERRSRCYMKKYFAFNFLLQ